MLWDLIIVLYVDNIKASRRTNPDENRIILKGVAMEKEDPQGCSDVGIQNFGFYSVQICYTY